MLKNLIKAFIESVVAIAGPHNWPTTQPKLLVLMYHRILPSGDERYQLEQPGMIVHPDTFAKHIRWLKKHFELVQLDDWLENSANNKKLPKKACAITFDDGWKDNYTHAFPVLKKEKCPATIFLVTDYINTSTTFWPEKLGYVLVMAAKKDKNIFNHESFAWLRELDCNFLFDSTMPDHMQLNDIINSAKKHSDKFLHEMIDTMARAANIELKFDDILSADDIREMQQSGLIAFGSHTSTHTRMSDELPEEILNYEIVTSKKSLQDKFGIDARTFCYPNGDTTTRASALVKEHYKSAVTTKKGWNISKVSQLALHRINMHEDRTNTRKRFLTNISGLF